MQKRRLGKTDIEVSPLGFGGAEIGFESAAAATVEKLLFSALDAGLNVIDTAKCYMNSEELIGQAVAHRRSEFQLFSKVGHADGFDHEDWSRAGILKSIERSLKRLRTDRLDLVQLHSCSEAELRKGEAIEALEEARKRGYTRFIGYSGDGQAARFALECDRFDTLQTSVSIADQEAIQLTLPLAGQKKIGVIAKRPIANAAWKHAAKPDNSYHVEYWERLGKLDYDFLKHDLNQAVATALRFTLSFPEVSTAIVGTQNPDRWKQNAALLDAGPLPAAQLESIRARWKQVAPATWGGQV